MLSVMLTSRSPARGSDVFNECATLSAVFSTVSYALPDVEKEIIVIDDDSSDGTREWLRAHFPDGPRSGAHVTVGEGGTLEFHGRTGVPQTTIRPLYHDRNRGKGAGLRSGLLAATGDVIVIQDADLEYDPADWDGMYDLIARRKVADVVYGSRFGGGNRHSFRFLQHLANRIISTAFRLLYGGTLNDVETCYKMFSREVGDCLHLTCDDFGCELQISAQIALADRWRRHEIGIGDRGRTYDEGKKIGWRDGVKALWYLVRFRLCPYGCLGPRRPTPRPRSVDARRETLEGCR